MGSDGYGFKKMHVAKRCLNSSSLVIPQTCLHLAVLSCCVEQAFPSGVNYSSVFKVITYSLSYTADQQEQHNHLRTNICIFST